MVFVLRFVVVVYLPFLKGIFRAGNLSVGIICTVLVGTSVLPNFLNIAAVVR